MTQFTRITVDPRNRHARWAMMSLERLHAIVARSVESGNGRSDDTRALWRLDPGRNGEAGRLYIVSQAAPDRAILCEEFGMGRESSGYATCDYEPFLNRLAIGQEWGFRLKANPTKSIPSGKPGVRGKRVGVVTVEEQIAWLGARAREYGFHMPINRLELPEIVVRDSRKVRFDRQGSEVTLASATYDGVLAVDDPELLRRALTQGIGRAKGYGFGLLTLVPIRGDSVPKESR
ncbi:type I-E CRISPR-associated protein Cas6/Cse3/CasE [Bifidobacterium amazonense]|uniref:Type I-E CRISPR-associated protein Cas6/Cse3/CasE n=1 Tax=Bifidobacterium amazonense TaxID=2809027 RepID=A0ABS9VVR2_9BIFI|nr:type I-E CRISPR-associated protein Cas6/Cse3/CasE [Bifidobacterium amazonense]MCH9276188.1 type I-E CRISPR-associated protein Cas6/Cse3/CasE [Bifidobacterium amazonense]